MLGMDFETIILCVYRSVAGPGCPWRIAYGDNQTGQMTDEGVGMRQDLMVAVGMDRGWWACGKSGVGWVMRESTRQNLKKKKSSERRLNPPSQVGVARSVLSKILKSIL